MLDLHCLYDGTGSATLAVAGTIPSNDGAVVAGVPIVNTPGVAKLVAWGAMGIDVAHGVDQITMQSADQYDPSNYDQWIPTGTSLTINSPIMLEFLPYATAARTVKYAQKAAGLVFTYTIDHYEPADVRSTVIMGSRLPPRRGMYSQTFGGALTAGAWGTKTFTPTVNLPSGKYAILGFWASALTNLALVRFQHADFGSVQPGFPVADFFITATTTTGFAGEKLLLEQGHQFVAMGEITGKPQCPVFRAGPNGTGLTIWAADLTADTPTIILNLAKVG